jgi:hypothetical protein
MGVRTFAGQPRSSPSSLRPWRCVWRQPRVHNRPHPQRRRLLGHGGAGKTTLIDACCHAAGLEPPHGSGRRHRAHHVHPGGDLARDLDERARWPTPSGRTQDQLHRHPGIPGLPGRDPRRGPGGGRRGGGRLRAGGVEVGTERVWEMVEERHLPAIFFVSMMDRRTPTSSGLPGHPRAPDPQGDPGGDADRERGRLPRDHQPLHRARAHLPRPGTQTGEYEEHGHPRGAARDGARYYEQLIETIAATDDTCWSTTWRATRSPARRRSTR